MVLTANVAELSILEDQKVLSSRDFLQALYRVFGEVIYDVRMRLESTYAVANLLCNLEQLARCVDICGDTKIRSLDGDEA